MNQNASTRNSFWQVLILLGILILILMILSQGIKPGTAYDQNLAYPGPETNLLIIGIQHENSACDMLYAQSQNLPPEKDKLMNEQDYKNCLNALSLTTDKKQDKPTDVPLPASDVMEMRPRRTAGAGIIIFGVVSRISPTTFYQTNTWYEKKGDSYIYVFAGANRASDGSGDLSDGTIFIDILNNKRDFIPGGGVYPTPIKAGPVTIVDANGEKITLSTQDGHVFYFDVDSRKYINPQGIPNNVSVKREIGIGCIVEDGRSPFIEQSFVFENQWYNKINGKRITVFAGKENDPNGRGVVMVVESIEEPTLNDNKQFFFTESQSSALRVFEIRENLLILVGVKGETFTFDIDSYKLSGPILVYTNDDPLLTTYEAPIPVSSSPIITKMPKPVITVTPQQAYP